LQRLSHACRFATGMSPFDREWLDDFLHAQA